MAGAAIGLVLVDSGHGDSCRDETQSPLRMLLTFIAWAASALTAIFLWGRGHRAEAWSVGCGGVTMLAAVVAFYSLLVPFMCVLTGMW